MKSVQVVGVIRNGETDELWVSMCKAAVKCAAAKQAAANTASTVAAREYHAANLLLLEAEGQGDGYDARWTRAWLAGDYTEAARLLTLHDQPYVRQEIGQKMAWLAEADGEAQS
jgi:hypothetical protein